MKKSSHPISSASFLARLKSRALDAVLFSLFSILFIGGIVYALTYPSAPPQGETAGGKFMNYFNAMLVNTGATTDGTVKKSEGVGKAGGTQAIYTTNNGNVGIGINGNSALKLDVNGPAVFRSYSSQIRLYETDATNPLFSWHFSLNGGNLTTYYGDDTTSGPYYPVMTQTNGGNIGIGTNTPNTAYKLDVAGAVNTTSLCINGECKTAWSTTTPVAPPGTSVYGGIAWQTTDTGPVTYPAAATYCNTLIPTGTWRIPSSSEMEYARVLGMTFTTNNWFWTNNPHIDYQGNLYYYSFLGGNSWYACDAAYSTQCQNAGGVINYDSLYVRCVKNL